MRDIALHQGAFVSVCRRWLAQAMHIALGVSHEAAANTRMQWFGALGVFHQKARNLGEQARVVGSSLTMLHLIFIPLLSVFHEISPCLVPLFRIF